MTSIKCLKTSMCWLLGSILVELSPTTILSMKLNQRGIRSKMAPKAKSCLNNALILQSMLFRIYSRVFSRCQASLVFAIAKGDTKMAKTNNLKTCLGSKKTLEAVDPVHVYQQGSSFWITFC